MTSGRPILGLARGQLALLPYQPCWAVAYCEEAQVLKRVLGLSDSDLEHIGSTAIPGMPAKPIIDLMLAVSSHREAACLIPRLESLGYQWMREDPRVPGRNFLARGTWLRRTHYLSLVPRGGAFWRDHLAFRDYLRRHSEAAATYASLKKKLMLSRRIHRGNYADAKASFVAEILRIAAHD